MKPRPGFGYGFDGAAGTWFWIDSTYDIAFVGMIQRAYWGWSAKDNVMGMPPNLEELSRAVAYQALIKPGL